MVDIVSGAGKGNDDLRLAHRRNAENRQTRNESPHSASIVAGRGLRYPGRVQTVEWRGSFFRFRVYPFDIQESELEPSKLLLEREVDFAGVAGAAAFLRQFAGDPFAARGLQAVLARVDTSSPVHELPDQWIERLAVHLHSGRVTVNEQVPRAPSGKATDGGGSPTPVRPLTRSSYQSSPSNQTALESTFPPQTSDEPAQAQALISAAKNGTPFCEECARAAAASGKNG